MRKISKNLLYEIHNLHSSGYSTRKIASMTGVSHMTVSNHLEKLSSQEMMHRLKGRPRKLSSKEIRFIVRQFELGVFRNAREACNQLLKDASIPVEKTTIARVLKSAGLNPTPSMPKSGRNTLPN